MQISVTTSWKSKLVFGTAAVVLLVLAAPVSADHPPGQGGHLTVGINTGPGGFDHFRFPVNARNKLMVMQAMHEKLYDFDADSGKLIPRLAESAMASDDFKRWRIKLRPGVKFSDGTPVTAAAYKLHFDTLLNSALGGRFRGFMGPRVDRVEAIDDLTIDFIFTEASPGFTRILAQPNLMWYVKSPQWVAANKGKSGGKRADKKRAAKKKARKGNKRKRRGGRSPFGREFNLKEVGAGPYMLKEWKRGNRINLVRNPHYYEPKLQHLDEIRFLIVPQQISRFQAMQAGQVDTGGIPPWLEDDARKDDGLSVKKGLNNIGGLGLAWNNAKPPFDDFRVRRALIQALDRRELTGIITKHVKDPPIDMFGKGHPWHCPNVKWPPMDPAAAKKLVNEYVEEKGKPVKATIVMPPLRDLQRVGEAMQAQWKKVGIDITIKSGPRGPANGRNIQNGRYDFWWANFGQNADPSLLMLNFHSQHRNNFYQLKDAKVDAAIDNLLAARGRDERYAASCAYQQELVDQSRFLVWELPARIIAFRKHVKNIPTPHALQIEFHRFTVK